MHCPARVNPLALSLNENPFPPLPAVRSALIESIDAANRYPEYLPERLRSLIAGRVGVRDEQVVIGVGATGVILQVLHAVTSPGEKMVMTSPTFDGYPIFAQMARLESVTVALDAHGHHDLDAMADAAAHARVVVVCRPHNPTGTVEPAADIERFLRRVPPDTVVVLDEAYVEFLPPEYRIDAPALVERYPNVVVLRTFSKAYGLAGLRIGYGFCAPDLARRLWTMQPPFGIGITSLVAVAASYDAESQLRQRIRMIASERRYLRMRLRSMGVVQHRRPCQLRLPAAVAPAVAGGVRRHRVAGPQLRRWQCADHRRQPAVDPRGAGRRGADRHTLRICPVLAGACGMKRRGFATG